MRKHDARTLDHATLEALRERAVQRVQEGESPEVVARVFWIGRTAIYRWLASVPEARASIGRYIDAFYNARRPHSSLDRRTPDEAYFTALQPIPVAA